jgi:serine/threonine-protein kinase
MKPDRIGQFEILAEIAPWAEGGAVYRAKDAKGRMVLLRTLRLDQPGAPEKLMRVSLEAKAASALASPNIAGVLGGGKAGDVYVVGWEFVEGVKLSATLEKGDALSPSEFTDLCRQICSGLDHAHSKGVIHPELKPGNILVEWDGTAKLLDFGVPRRPIGSALSEALHYISPEELQGKQPGPRANLFSWGAILYQMAAGQRPFTAQSAEELRCKILEEMPPAPHEVKKDVHRGVSQIILKALAKVPGERYSSGAELMRDLEKYKRVEVAPPAPPKPAAPPPRPVTAQTPAVAPRPQPAPVASPPPAPAAPTAPTPTPVGASTPPVQAAVTQAPASPVPEAPAPAQPAAPVAEAPKAERPAAAKVPAAPPPAARPKLLMYGMVGVIALLLVIIAAIVLLQTPSQPEAAPAATTTTPATPGEAASATPAPAGTPATPPPSGAISAPGAAPGSAARPARTKQPAPEPAKPAVVQGQVAIDSAPQGAEIQIDGRHEPAWITPYTASLDPGQHTVTMSMTGRMSATRTVEITSGKKTALAVGLAERAATISVNSDPAEAVILLDGQATGKVTPTQLIVAKGSHTVTVRKQGYLDATSTLELAPGQSAQFAPTLKLTGSTQDIKTAGGIGGLFGGAPKDAGRVTVRTNPKGAQVLVNGQAVKKTTPVDFFLNPGNYEITLALAGHKPVKKIITVEKGGKVVLDETIP